MPLYPTFTTLAAELGDKFDRTLQKILQCVQKTPIARTALASAARTVSTLSSDIAMEGCKGIILYLNVTAAAGVGGLRLNVLLKDPVSGAYRGMVQTNVSITVTGMVPVVIYPGAGIGSGMALGATTMGIIGIPLGATIQVQVVHATADSYTYTLGYELIP